MRERASGRHLPSPKRERAGIDAARLDPVPMRVRAGSLGALGVVPLLLCGCLSPECKIEIRDGREAVERINANYARITKPLQGSPALVSFRFKDADGRDQRFIGHPAALLFEPPRCLYFSIRSPLAGQIAEIGSRDELYHFWVDVPDAKKLWWGTWAALEAGRARKFAVSPDQLLDALMLQAPRESMPGGLRPFLLVADGKQRLQFMRVGDESWPHPAREMHLDAAAPHLPTRIIDYDSEGKVVLDAEFGNYRPIEDAGAAAPLTPRRYVILWPLDSAELRLDLDRVCYYDGDAPICDFDPRDWRFDKECLDLTGPRPARRESPTNQ